MSNTAQPSKQSVQIKVGTEQIRIGSDEWEEYVEGIYEVLMEMGVTLDPNPLEYGPSSLSEKIAQCREYLGQCDKIFLTLSQAHHHTRKALTKATQLFALGSDQARALDPEVRAGRSDKEREAIVTMKLIDERKEIMRLESALQDIDVVLKVVKAKQADLKDTRGRIKDQITLCQEELALGNKWGKTKREPLPELKPTGPEENEEEINIDDILDDSKGNSLFHGQEPGHEGRRKVHRLAEDPKSPEEIAAASSFEEDLEPTATKDDINDFLHELTTEDDTDDESESGLGSEIDALIGSF